jgi:hypothetical protein
MNHNFARDEKFNILTAKREKGNLIFTGETREPLEVGDTINYPFNDKQICFVDKIIKRRDSKDYPGGNGLWYKCECTAIDPPPIEQKQ